MPIEPSSALALVNASADILTLGGKTLSGVLLGNAEKLDSTAVSLAMVVGATREVDKWLEMRRDNEHNFEYEYKQTFRNGISKSVIRLECCCRSY